MKTFWTALKGRYHYLTTACDYDLIKAGNALILIGMAVVLLQPGDYLQSNPVLSQLEQWRWATELRWAGLLLLVGQIEFALFFLTGTPPMLATNTREALKWHWVGAIGFLLCISVFASIMFILKPPHGIGWGNITFGVCTAGNLYGCYRTGKKISVDREMVKIKQLRALAVSALDAKTIDAIVSRFHAAK